MSDYRKYACDISGSLFKNVNKKGVRREKLATELGISVNQLKNYAYDSTKSATLENFMQVLIDYKCVDVLANIAKDMECSICKLPTVDTRADSKEVAAEALVHTSKSIFMYLENNRPKEEISKEIYNAIEKLVYLEKNLNYS